MITNSLVLIVSYLLGSVLFGVIVSRVVKGMDPRDSASGNPGATNVMRVAGKGAGAAALLLDAAKGAAAVLLAHALSPAGSTLPAAAAVVVVLGHLFPVFYSFRGGKGVATALGAFLVLTPQPVLVAMVLFVAVLGAYRFVSLASMTAAVSVAPLSLVWGEPPVETIAGAFACVLIVARHHGNVSRLRRGVEPRLSRLTRWTK